MNTEFKISDNTSEFCYEPFVCSIKDNYIVSWVQNFNDDFSKVYVKNINNGIKYVLTTVSDKDKVLFFKRYSDDSLMLAIDKNGKNVCYILKLSGELVYEQVLLNNDLLLDAHKNLDKNVNVFFYYSYENKKLTVSDINNYTINNVYSLPQIIRYNDTSFCLGWLNEDNELVISILNNKTLLNQYKICPYYVDYLIGTIVKENTLMFGGYNNSEKQLEFNYFDIKNDELIRLNSNYLKNEIYNNKNFFLKSLKSNGFMLMSEEENGSVKFQRFTHLGSWLYSLVPVNTKYNSWSPYLDNNDENALMVYIKDLEDGHTQIWGSTIKVNKIPEIEHVNNSKYIIH